MLISDYLLVQILRIALKYKSEVFLGLFADARIGILGLSQAGAWEGDNLRFLYTALNPAG